MSTQLGLFDRAATPPVMRALSLWQPWAYAVSHLGKPLDNRPWKPWRSVIGQRIAIHAAMGHGTKADFDRAAAFIGRVARVDIDRDPHRATALAQRGCIVATAIIDGCVTTSDDPWFFGPFGWLLSDLRVLARPVACRGMQGLWSVPEELRREVWP